MRFNSVPQSLLDLVLYFAKEATNKMYTLPCRNPQRCAEERGNNMHKVWCGERMLKIDFVGECFWGRDISFEPENLGQRLRGKEGSHVLLKSIHPNLFLSMQEQKGPYKMSLSFTKFSGKHDILTQGIRVWPRETLVPNPKSLFLLYSLKDSQCTVFKKHGIWHQIRFGFNLNCVT